LPGLPPPHAAPPILGAGLAACNPSRGFCEGREPRRGSLRDTATLGRPCLVESLLAVTTLAGGELWDDRLPAGPGSGLFGNRWLHSMRMEVEQKFPVADLDAVALRLAALGAAWGEVRHESDLYFAHPARDFARTDEALRIRRVGSRAYLTYKGPKVDTTSKTRHEIDLALPDAAAAPHWQQLLEALGFRPLAEVRKTRRKALLPWLGRQVEVSLDTVDDVGTYVELELVTDTQGVEPAKEVLQSLAAQLGLRASERRSYLELLLERRAGSALGGSAG